ncbi:hypothetical protein AAGS40_25790 (plasmid) [Paraburkholderia sp. PREW-6R]|uniref:hypothetical protein n=1 Tax=Paraburkholderia sp. PREW-6R TaxID=3141544 RepID=UPI0031F48AB5
MDNGDTSLRGLVDKWVGLSPATAARVFRVGRQQKPDMRCVRIEVSRASGPLSLLFFRHADGSWRVFPPAANRPTFYSGQSSRGRPGLAARMR